MQNTAAAVTMVKGDYFFLSKWVAYYGGLFGRKSCYVIAHGEDPKIEDIASGCNVITIPFEPNPSFDVIRWRLLNAQTQALINYYKHVIVGDVDELVVIDPDISGNLHEYLSGVRTGQVLTPIGLEITHLPNEEKDGVEGPILGPRRFARHVASYSKPCVVSATTKLSRGGHFAKTGKFNSPDGLFLFHLKYSDFTQYAEAMDRRNAFTASTGAGFREASVGRHWFEGFRGDDAEIFKAFHNLERKPFEFSGLRQKMRDAFEPRGDSGFWHSTRENEAGLFEIPERFFGMF